MKTSEYATMAAQEKTYWWHLGRLRIIQLYVKRVKNGKRKFSILNIGCGTGGTIDMLEAFGKTDNVDVSDQAIEYMKSQGYKNVRKVNDTELPYKDSTYDMVGAFDVLEHIENENAALMEWRRVINDGGKIVITVPAYQWLWSNHDVSLHHKRRYTRKRLILAAQKAGLVPEKVSYAIVFSLPLVSGYRLLNKFLSSNSKTETSYVRLPSWLNSLFSQLLYLEARMHKFISFPLGTSVIGVFKKNDTN